MFYTKMGAVPDSAGGFFIHPTPLSCPGERLGKMRRACRITLSVTLLVLLWHGALPAACKEESFVSRLLPPAYAAAPDATLHYFGHSFFQLVTRRGTRVVMDPPTPGRYPTPDVSADVVTIGREHPNHNWVPIVRGRR